MAEKSTIYEKYDIEKKVEEVKPQLTEAFVKVYGEKYRDLITQRINKINIITVITQQHLEHFLNMQFPDGNMSPAQHPELAEEIEEYERATDEISKISIRKNEAFISQILPNLPEELRKKVETANSYYTAENIMESLGYPAEVSNYAYLSPFESFSKDCDEILKTKPDSKKAKSIIRSRIDFFKMNGVDLGENYEAYINSPEIAGILPSQDVINNIANLRRKMNSEYRYESLSVGGNYRENAKRLEELGYSESECLLPVTHTLDFGGDTMGCAENHVSEKAEHIDDRVIYIPILRLIDRRENIDEIVIHEIGHALEMELIQNENSTYTRKSGISFAELPMATKVKPEEFFSTDVTTTAPKKSVMANEAIHDKLTKEVIDILHNEYGASITNYGTESSFIERSYTQAFQIVKPFFEEYREQMIDAIMTSQGFDMFTSTYQYPGYERIIDLCDEFEQLDDDSYLSDQLYSNEHTNETERYSEMLEEARAITTQTRVLEAFEGKEIETLGISDINTSKNAVKSYINKDKDQERKTDDTER